MQAAVSNQSVQLLEGCFAPAEIRELLIRSIDDQINFYKLKSLSDWIHDCECSQEDMQSRIQRLEETKRDIADMVREAKLLKKNIRINQTLNISFE